MGTDIKFNEECVGCILRANRVNTGEQWSFPVDNPWHVEAIFPGGEVQGFAYANSVNLNKPFLRARSIWGVAGKVKDTREDCPTPSHDVEAARRGGGCFRA